LTGLAVGCGWFLEAANDNFCINLTKTMNSSVLANASPKHNLLPEQQQQEQFILNSEFYLKG
jgi:hypothetical protein